MTFASMWLAMGAAIRIRQQKLRLYNSEAEWISIRLFVTGETLAYGGWQ